MIRAKNKSDFIDNIKLSLGGPVINIPVSDDQFDLIIEEALNFYTNYVYDGVEEVFFTLEQNIGVKEFDFTATGMPQNIHSIKEILYTTYTEGLFPMPYGVTNEAVKFFFAMGSMGHGNMADGSIMFQNLEMFKKMFLPKHHWDFNFNTQRLTMDANANMYMKLGVLATRLIDFEGNSVGNLWNNNFFKKYVLALTKKQMGINMGGLLVSGASGPGGSSVNFEKLIDASIEEIKELESFAMENLCGSEIYKIEIG